MGTLDRVVRQGRTSNSLPFVTHLRLCLERGNRVPQASLRISLPSGWIAPSSSQLVIGGSKEELSEMLQRGSPSLCQAASRPGAAWEESQ